MRKAPPVHVKDLCIGYGDRVVQRDLTFKVESGEIFLIMGGSGCGKSTLLRHMIGLMEPLAGDVYYGDESYWRAGEPRRNALKRTFGVLYQQGALWSAMTVGENVALPLEQYTPLSKADIQDVVAYKLALVGLSGYEDHYPAQLSGGMKKRAALARAMALDPDILFFDEPSAGLDPVNARLLDELILRLRDSLGASFIVVTHELESIFAIGDNGIFLDGETQTAIAMGAPKTLKEQCTDPKVRAFLMRRLPADERSVR
ncbi:ABC transporter ATP-binding protein [Methylogaea oryzae]|uniref:Polyamine ABC transporter ATP-binding protein n=1 Tax=Methylogaea oryzae TaxID=1295382 RepID=A0A8D4VS58_9GAMM|nr:ATP-binding cassette domain-containing protein [Methylogaea oryzae]BBL72309.1 polyamine ABC transporter ATP-binding protein [Methylogaea oryzae]